MRASVTPLLTGLMVLLFTLFVLTPGPANAVALPFSADGGLVARTAEAFGSSISSASSQFAKRKGSKSSGSKSKGKKKISGGVIAAIIIVIIVVIVIVAVLLFLRARKAKKNRVPH